MPLLKAGTKVRILPGTKSVVLTLNETKDIIQLLKPPELLICFSVLTGSACRDLFLENLQRLAR